MKTGLLTGSFDPVTFGHLDIFERAATTFDKVIVGVGNNPSKKYLFSDEARAAFIRQHVKAPNIEVAVIGSGLTADFAYEQNAVLIKGVRMGGSDFDYERLMHDINHAHQAGLETFILPCSPHLHWISSSAAKEVCKLHGLTETFVPLAVKEQMERRLTGALRIGLTGTIASGKSTLARQLCDAGLSDGTPIHNIDLDKLGHEILFERTEPAYVLLRGKLQADLGLSDWSRKSVGAKVFGDASARAVLNAAMEQPLRTRLRYELTGKTGVILFNGALLVEAGWAKLVNNNFLLLDVPEELQRERLLARGHTAAQIQSRIGAQFTTQTKLLNIRRHIAADGHGQSCVIQTGTCLDESFQYARRWLDELWQMETDG